VARIVLREHDREQGSNLDVALNRQPDGKTLLLIAQDPRIRLRDIAERATHRIVAELARAGYVNREREGRRNVYSVRTHLPLGLPVQRDIDIGSLLAVGSRRTIRATTEPLRTRVFPKVGPHRVRRRKSTEEHHMYATVRRYEGIDKVRSEEVTSKVDQSLLPSLSQLPGFVGYYLIDAGEGVLASVSLFADAKQAHESTRVAARWVREQKLEDALPNTPKITAGQVSAHHSPVAAAVANGVPALA